MVYLTDKKQLLMNFKQSIFLVILLTTCSLLFSQNFGELKSIKGKVIDSKKEALENVNVYDVRGTKLATTNEEGTFAFNYNIVLNSRVKPVFRFIKKGYLPHNYKYDYRSYITIQLEKEVKKEVVPKKAVVEETKIVENSNQKVETKSVVSKEKIIKPSPKKNKEIHLLTQKLTESLESLEKEKKVSKKEIQVLKDYIEYLEATLLASNITFSEDTTIHKSEIQKQLTTLKTKIEEKEVEIQRVEKQKENLVYSIIGIVFLLIPSILAIIFYRNNRKTQKLNIVLEEQVVQITHQNEEIATQRDNIIEQSHKIEEAYSNIHASILYAKKIQESILIKPQGITQYFDDAFIFYQPKDIVSGDFYWFSSVGDKLIIAAVDCTGHGVPGAFMTMMGNTILNEIVNEKGITNPADILAELNLKIHHTLNQDDVDNAHDGMDMALVCVDSSQQEIVFAGANNPLYYVSNDEILEVKATRRGIGGEIEKTFVNHTLSLKDVSAFYLFSDGFQDQFGGSDDKKYMKKRFRNFLYQISREPFQKQQALIQEELETWKGDTVQTDDIVIIGVNPL